MPCSRKLFLFFLSLLLASPIFSASTGTISDDDMQVVEIGGSTTSEVSLSPRTAEVDGLEAQQRPSSLLISSDEDRRDVTAPLSWNQRATPPGGWEEYLGSPVLSIGADHFPGEREEELVFFSQGIRPVEGQGAREAREGE